MNDPREIRGVGSMIVEGFGVNDERALRDEINAREADMAWQDRSPEERAAMASLVRDALLRLADDVEAWLPSAAVATSNTSWGFFVWWKNRHLEEEIIAQRIRADREDQDRMSDLLRMAGRADEDDRP